MCIGEKRCANCKNIIYEPGKIIQQVQKIMTIAKSAAETLITTLLKPVKM